MQQAPSSSSSSLLPAATIDSQFALLHGLTPGALRVLLELFPQISSDSANPESHPASAPSCSAATARDVYRLRFEAAEKRYARMKGLVHASLEAQQRLERELAALRVAKTIADLGLAEDCSAILGSMRRAAGGVTVLEEVDALAGRLEAALKQNAALVRFNRDLRGLPAAENHHRSGQMMMGGSVYGPAVVVDHGHPVAMECSVAGDGGHSSAVTSSMGGSAERLVAEIETLRKHIIALELEFARLQSDAFRFEQDERLRECEDVFDALLGRERQDYHCDNPGTDQVDRLRRYHPAGTCSNPACQAYARRLRGGLRLAVAEAYARERAARMNGLVRHCIEPVEALRARKDAEIRALQERIRRFEQSTRMTGAEADEVELRAVSLEILDRAAELADIRVECARAEREYTRRRSVLAQLAAEERAMQEEVMQARVEVQSLIEERQLTARVANDMREEAAKLEALRAEISRFQSGQAAKEFDRQKRDAADLAIEIENLRIERGRVAGGAGAEQHQLGGEEDEVVADSAFIAMAGVSGGGPALVSSTRAGPASSSLLSSAQKRPKKASAAGCPDIFPSPDGTVIIKCRCGDFVPIGVFGAHVQSKHSSPSKKTLLCGAGCGVFVVNRPMSDLDNHRRSGECARRVAEISRLMAGDGR